jgi:hypothetical protein
MRTKRRRMKSKQQRVRGGNGKEGGGERNGNKYPF